MITLFVIVSVVYLIIGFFLTIMGERNFGTIDTGNRVFFTLCWPIVWGVLIVGSAAGCVARFFQKTNPVDYLFDKVHRSWRGFSRRPIRLTISSIRFTGGWIRWRGSYV